MFTKVKIELQKNWHFDESSLMLLTKQAIRFIQLQTLKQKMPLKIDLLARKTGEGNEEEEGSKEVSQCGQIGNGRVVRVNAP